MVGVDLIAGVQEEAEIGARGDPRHVGLDASTSCEVQEVAAKVSVSTASAASAARKRPTALRPTACPPASFSRKAYS
jgi:hypothetical protein